jgi:hypothetical protein
LTHSTYKRPQKDIKIFVSAFVLTLGMSQSQSFTHLQCFVLIQKQTSIYDWFYRILFFFVLFTPLTIIDF